MCVFVGELAWESFFMGAALPLNKPRQMVNSCAKIYFIILGLVALSAESEKDSERVSI